MGFWIFMLVMVLLFPAIMMVMGRYFMKRSPQEINCLFGYRTTMSMKNKETWDFAHRYFGKQWFYLGLILVPVTVIPMLFVIGSSEETIGTVGCVLCMVALVILMLPILFTERALKKNFDNDGHRRTED